MNHCTPEHDRLTGYRNDHSPDDPFRLRQSGWGGPALASCQRDRIPLNPLSWIIMKFFCTGAPAVPADSKASLNLSREYDSNNVGKRQPSFKRSPLSRAPSEIANDSRKIIGGWLYPVFYLNSCRIIKLLSLIRYPFFFSPKEYTFPDLSKNLFCQMEKRKRTI